MATYKVPQNVEAEDKLLGPLTFKQFIFFLIASGAALFGWLFFQIHPLLALLPLPVIIIFGGLAVFRREDQPAERYLLSFFNFMLRPRQRAWNTEGYYEHLVIRQQKKAAPPPLKQDISQVHSQLERLAQVVDTRGWAAKRPELITPNGVDPITQGDDRLFMPGFSSQPVDDIQDDEDIMDEQNPEAQHLDTLLEEQTKQRKEQLMQNVRQQVAEAQSTEGGNAASEDTPHFDPYGPSNSHLRSIDPGGTRADSEPPPEPPTETTAKAPVESAILEQALQVSGDVSVARTAELANRKPEDDSLQEGKEIKLR